MAEVTLCVRCEQQGAIEDGLCGHCKWVVRTEVEQGLQALRVYLGNWWQFDDWCRDHQAAA